MATYYVNPAATSNNCGGTDADDSQARSGTDGVTNNSTTFESETADFVAGDAGRGIWVNATTPVWRLISSVTDENTVVLNAAITTTQTGLSWKIGGTWQTLAHAIGFSTNGRDKANGDKIYLAPGIYRETVTAAITNTAEVQINGDPQNTMGFKNASAVSTDAAPVVLTALTTDDVSAAAAADTLDTGGCDYLTFQDMLIEGGIYSTSYYSVDIPSTSTNIVLRRCYIFEHLGTAIRIITAANTTHSHVIDSCIISSRGVAFQINVTKHTADYDFDITIKNSLLFGESASGAVFLNTAGTGTTWGSGLDVQNCMIVSYTGVNVISSINVALTYRFNVKNCLIYSATAVQCGASTSPSLINEDYNILVALTPRNNVDTGSNSFSSSTTTGRAVRFDLGALQLWGFQPRSFGWPFRTSRHIGFGNDSTPTALTTDILGRPRPSGSGLMATSTALAVGPYELHDFGTKDTAVKDAGDASIRLKGPGDHEVLIPVDASSTTIKVKVYVDGTGDNDYGTATGYPQAILVDTENFANITGDTETKTATVSCVDAWEELTFTAFTPSRKGVVRLRLYSRDSNGDGYCYFDTVTVT